MRKGLFWSSAVLTSLLWAGVVSVNHPIETFAAQKGGKGGGGGGRNQGGGGGGGRNEGGGGQKGGGPAQIQGGGGADAGGNKAGGGPRVDEGRGGGTPGGAVREKIQAQPRNDGPRNDEGPRNVAPRNGGSRNDGPDGGARIRGNVGGNNGPNIRGTVRGNMGDGRGNNVRLRTNLNNLPNRYAGGTNIRLGSRDINIVNRNYRPAHFRHNWYRGYWSGNWGWGPGWGYGGPGRYTVGYRGNIGPNWGFNWRYGANGRNRWWNGYRGNRPLGWGLGAWGVGSLAYRSGYLPYYNPYYSSNFGYGYNYSAPINIAYDDGQSNPPSETDVLDGAIAAFQEGNYQSALEQVNQAITDNPRDPSLHEFRSLVLFAMGDYQESAAVAHAVLALGPGWDWETLSSLYPDVNVYTEQYRKLESFSKSNPEDASAKFLLAYHYLTGGHPEAAAKQLHGVVKLNPQDRVSQDILQMITANNSSTDNPTVAANENAPNSEEATAEQTESLPVPSEQTIQPERLAGNWTAERENGDKFELIVTPDSEFTWNFQPKENGEPQTIKGKVSAEGNVLAMESPEQGTLVAVVEPQGDKKFNLKLLGAPENDGGLIFSQQN